MVLSKDIFSFSKHSQSGEIAKHRPLSRSSSISTANILESLPSGPERDPLLHKINMMFTPESPSFLFKQHTFIKDLHELCKRVIEIMSKEDRLLKLSSPICKLI